MEKIRPLLKWAGGKSHLTKLLPNLSQIPFSDYHEPFFGGGAFFWNTKPANSFISDNNEELINFYKVLQENPRELLALITSMKKDKASYYHWRSKKTEKMTRLERAARIYYLNRLCYGGLYRVNRNGEFNVPYGHYEKREFIDSNNFLNASKALSGAKIQAQDFERSLALAEKSRKPLIIIDPPYFYPKEGNDNFNRYSKEKFTEEMHLSLIDKANHLAKNGAYIIFSNSDNREIINLLDGKIFEIRKIEKQRSFTGKRAHQEILATSKNLLETVSNKGAA